MSGFGGGCACGAVAYTVDGEPLSMVNCHCRSCQRAGGASHSPTVVVSRSALRITRGSTRSYERIADSGNVARREFCADCGSPLFASSAGRPDRVGIRAASLEDPSWFKPTVDLFTGEAQPWDVMDPDLPKLPSGRPRN